jgi:hypothetical protein
MTLQLLSRHRLLAAFFVSTLAVTGCNRSNQQEDFVDTDFDDGSQVASAPSNGGLTVEELAAQRRIEAERQVMQNLVV